MGKQTKIEWCDSTVNFITGCTKVSPGCANCYAETLSNRDLGHIGKWGPGAPRRIHESAGNLAYNLNRKPLVCDECGYADSNERWHTPHLDGRDRASACECSSAHTRRIFSNSLGDWLDPEVLVDWLAWMLGTIRECSSVNWLLLTKRPELWAMRMCAVRDYCNRGDMSGDDANVWAWVSDWIAGRKVPQNIWLGTSVEDQQRADERIPALLRIPAEKRFLSIEPLLGPVDVASVEGCTYWDHPSAGIGWVIIGGESGPKARPCDVAWVRSLIGQCLMSAVPCFVKQLGARPCGYWVEGAQLPFPDAGWRLRVADPKGAYPWEWPEDLRVRELPGDNL